MATDGTFLLVQNKKILPFDLYNGLVQYLRNLSVDLEKNLIRKPGIFDTAVVVAASGVNDAVDIAQGTGFTASDGLGHCIKFAAADSRLNDVKFQNTAATVYHFGLQYAEVEDGAEINPRTGVPNYVQKKEQVGRKGDPTSVTDLGGGSIRVNVNALITTPGSNSHAGRLAMIWLKVPQSGVAATAFQTATIAFSAGNNTVDVGYMGQGAPSTFAADYNALIIGPTVTRLSDLDLRTASGVVFLAAATGTGPAAIAGGIVTTDQNVITFSLSDFDDVLRRDSHGDMKLLVTADSSDAEEPQVEVKNSGGTTTWKVDEDGDQTGNDAIMARYLLSPSVTRNRFFSAADFTDDDGSWTWIDAAGGTEKSGCLERLNSTSTGHSLIRDISDLVPSHAVSGFSTTIVVSLDLEVFDSAGTLRARLWKREPKGSGNPTQVGSDLTWVLGDARAKKSFSSESLSTSGGFAYWVEIEVTAAGASTDFYIFGGQVEITADSPEHLF